MSDKDKDVEATYDWCWQCCAYHRDGSKECKRQRPFRGDYGSAEDKAYQEELRRLRDG